ncbi:MAG: chitobiase/beta-hexosaminidase C-terminal domain-containing protein, partial [Verrucomicrobiota bacterium]
GNSSASPLVTFKVTPGTNAICVAITETLAPGIGATGISPGGNYVASNNVVLWGPFFGTNAFSVSYQAVGLPGAYPAKMSWSVDGVSGTEATGTNLVIAAGGVNGVIPTMPPQVATPAFSPPSGASVPVSVTITDATPGAVIYYTLDGSLPTPSSTPYSGAVPLATASVLRAAAFTNGWTPSVAAAAFYGPAASPANAQVTRSVSGNSSASPLVTFNVTPGTNAICVAITETLAPGIGATGISPGGNYVASNNAVLWGPFFGTNIFSVSYQAVGLPGAYPAKMSWSVDGVSGTEATGTNLVIAAGGVNGVIPTMPSQVATPVLLPASASNLPVSVTITDTTPGAVIFYTLDGSLPTPGSMPYTGAVPLASASVLRAVAFTNGWTPSVAAVGEYVPVLTTNTVAVTNSVAGNATYQPTVSLTATPHGAVNCYAVVETIPFGLTPYNLTGDGVWDPIAGAIRWGPYLDNQPRVFSFNVSGASGIYLLSGQVSVNGYSMSAGATNVQINTSVIGSAPQIGTQPSNQVALAGSTAQFTVGASGSSPLIYQWYFNTNTPLFSPSPVAALSLSNLTTQSAGRYSVVITNAFGSVTSSVASLTVVTPLVTNIVNGSNGSMTLSFVGLPNATTRIWATTNLALPSSWQPIFTNVTTSPGGTWQFTDTNNAAYPMRFYRFSTP